MSVAALLRVGVDVHPERHSPACSVTPNLTAVRHALCLRQWA